MQDELGHGGDPSGGAERTHPSPVVGLGELEQRAVAARAADQLHAHRQPAGPEPDRHAGDGQPGSDAEMTTSIQRW